MKRLCLALAVALVCAGCATLDDDDRALLRQHRVSPELYDRMTHDEPLRLSEIVELSQRRVPPRFIIHYLRETDTVYPLNSRDVTRLRKAGVTAEVVDYLLGSAAEYGPPPRVYGGPWYPYEPGWYPYGPYYEPYPRVFVVGGGGGRFHHFHGGGRGFHRH